MVQHQQSYTDTTEITRLASSLLDVAPRLLQRLSADVPLTDEEEQVWQRSQQQKEHATDKEVDKGLRVVSELRSTPGQLSLLHVLVEHERCMMQEIAEHLAITPSTATALVKRLVASGYVERSRDDADWRTVWIHATERGRQAVALYDAVRLASLKKRLERLSEEERRRILDALPALWHLIEA